MELCFLRFVYKLSHVTVIIYFSATNLETAASELNNVISSTQA